jgi:hypothetical protein
MSRLAPLLCAGLLLAGCGGEGEGGDAQREVRQTLDQLQRARQRGDAETACRQLVAVSEPGDEAAAGGRGEAGAESEREAEGDRSAAGEAGALGNEVRPGACERAFAVATAGLRGLRAYRQQVGDVEVHGDRATARVRVVAVRGDGSRIVRTVTYRLARRDGRWRVLLSLE